MSAGAKPIQIETFNSFPVNQIVTFDISYTNNIRPNDLLINISNSLLGNIDKQVDLIQGTNGKCRVAFKVPIVGVYSINVEPINHAEGGVKFQAKAYDLSKVFINGSSGRCYINEHYEFSVDASEAGEGQLEIAVNEGEIPNQVQVLDNGKCIVSFVPEDVVPHVVDIKFNGHNVNGCPFVVEVLKQGEERDSSSSSLQQPPALVKEERVLVNVTASFSIDHVRLDNVQKEDLIIIDPENQPVPYKLTQDAACSMSKIEFTPSIVGDYTVELRPKSELCNKLPSDLLVQFPFSIKVYDFNKVLVSDVTDGVVGHPIYFFIDASQAGSGNLEIRVSSKIRNVPNYPQSEANAKIRVNFTPTEAVDHTIDVKFNGISVPGNPFLVKVAPYPQARLPIASQDLLKYAPMDEVVDFYIDYIGSKENKNLPAENLTSQSCQVYSLQPDFVYTQLDAIQIESSNKNEKQKRFKVSFKPTKIGPYKLFMQVNNELLPSSPIICNVYNINEVKVFFDDSTQRGSTKPIGQVNKPVSFTVDASKAGEGTLALAVVSGLSRSPVQTDVKVSEKGHGLYNLTFIPEEFSPHSIDMSFNERVVPGSPFIVDILDTNGRSSLEEKDEKKENTEVEHQTEETIDQQQMVQNFEAMNLKQNSSKALSKSPTKTVAKTKKSLAFGLVNASNIVYLESGVLDGAKSQVTLVGPNDEKVPFVMGKGSPQSDEPKKPFIEYKPKSIGTHTINVVDGSKSLRQYFVEICDPNLVRITDLEPADRFVVGKPVTFCIDSGESGEIQLDSLTILGPKRTNGKVRDGEHTILSRIKSISSSSHNHNATVEYSIHRLNNYKQEVRFIPTIIGKYSIDIRCLGQSVRPCPFDIDVRGSNQPEQTHTNTQTLGKGKSKEEELLQNIVVHGISLKCSPVNSTGAFIIETNRLAQARDFDVVIIDPINHLVDVQCYLQPDGNLLAEWTPKRVGAHKIEVLYKDKQVPGSPFVTEAFDPSAVLIENTKTTVYSIGDKIEFRLNRKEAGCGELDVAVTSPVGQDLPIDIQPLEEGDVGEIISFTPSIAGKYRLSITFGGYEIPKSPLTFTARDMSEPVKVSGAGLRCAEVNRSASFSVESSSEGELKLRIESGGREIVPKVEKHANTYTIKYKPAEVGYATISLYWNGSPVEGSPYSVPVNDLSKILFLSGTNKLSTTSNQRIIDYEPRTSKEITLDTSKCGPGDLKVEAYCRANPNIKFSLPVNQYATNRYKIIFNCPPSPEQLAKGINPKDISVEATYLIRLYYNNLFVPETLASVVVSPLQTSTSGHSSGHQYDSSSSRSNRSELGNGKDMTVEKNNNSSKPIGNGTLKPLSKNGIECPVVALRGHGLVEAKCGEKAEFTIDGTEAGPGKPEVRFNSLTEEITIRLERIDDRVYRASYVPQSSGIYSLNVLWDGRQVAGCPISVNIAGDCDPTRVVCTGDGLKGGILGEEIKCFIDTRRAGPGELTALCTGPQKVAFCELLDRGDGTFILYIKPQEAGRQFLTIKYGGQHIPKSPFLIKVSGKPDPSKVRVYGPGVEHGVLSLYQSRFVCDTRGAGAGQLTVRIRGPKGAFRMETQRESQRDRTILCKYDPTEPGDYRIEIKWSGRHVPGSPFSVMIFDTQEELNRFLVGGQPSVHPKKLAGPVLHHQVPYQPAMVDYGHYSNMATTNQQQQSPFRL